jgi:hypothetical protein
VFRGDSDGVRHIAEAVEPATAQLLVSHGNDLADGLLGKAAARAPTIFDFGLRAGADLRGCGVGSGSSTSAKAGSIQSVDTV